MEGTPFGRYRLQHLIGRGGMGEVWRAYDVDTHRVVAIKLLPTDTATDDEFVERFRREARVAAGLNSPNIVPIHNFGEIDGRLYVDMQVIDGRDLEEVLDDGPMRPERAVRIIEQVAAALRAAHHAGLVHRDVKPSNILLNRDDFAYLIDFGLARTDDDAGLTVTGHTVGTLTYMAPERYDSRPVDLRTDIYSLACVLYQCLTGRRPFPGAGSDQMIAHISAPPPQPTEFVRDLPRGFDTVIATGMAKEPAERYQTVIDFARAAREALTEARPPSYDFSYPTTNPGWSAQPPPTQRVWQPPQTVVVPRPAPTPPWRRTPVLVSAVCLVVSVVAITSAVLAVTGRSAGAGEAAPTTTAAANTTTVGDATYGEQVNLPNQGIQKLQGIAATASGGVVGLCCRGSIYEIADGAAKPAKREYLAATGPGIATDGQGNLYVGGMRSGVQRLDDGLRPTTLPFPPLDNPRSIAVDPSGAVYVSNLTSAGVYEIWKLDAGATAAVKLPFDNPTLGAVAVDSTGVVYSANLFSRSLLQLRPGAQQPTEVRLGEGILVKAVAVGEDDAVYIGSRGDTGTTVYRIAPGASKAEQLPIKDFTWDVTSPGLAVNDNGDVFVADSEKNRVVKLPRVQN
ncbi:serine/threonine-protein kinase [Mycolicibacterium arenosum]|uniref:non-specific serine/threonine protein kinase n=1 Tax=Mycolicibacterium arenosum TaxID=2952157 RepID=A0ABT1LZX7_9MYCO|nr:serine/threonine-protein kinase [Mycolicibacterium sp. CAU 1645]MCP9272454.1 serine/threonine-protein kinase [Mycolicibacterium sp. CAU 1645]